MPLRRGRAEWKGSQPVNSSTTLSRISEALQALSAAKTLDDVLNIRDQAEALRVYVKAACDSLEAANAASEIKLRAERKAGAMLAAMDKPKGGRPPKTPDIVSVVSAETSLAELGVTDQQSSRWQREAKVPEHQFQEYLELCRDEGREVTQAGLLKVLSGAHVGFNSGNSEWYTPQIYANAAREVMGGIDIDPCSCEDANRVIKATKFFDEHQDGFAQEWNGRLYTNPPYGEGTIDKFSEKLLAEFHAQRVKQAIVLVNNCTETKWFQGLLRASSNVCFPMGRISFWSVDRPSKNPLQGQAFLHFCFRSQDGTKFRRVFGQFGVCISKG
jgi:hypothetical protein